MARRLQLTDEEIRHINQRRDNEKRFALGYNQAFIDLTAWLDDQTEPNATLEAVSVRRLLEHMNSLRKATK